MFIIQLFEPVHRNWHTAGLATRWSEAKRKAEEQVRIEQTGRQYGQPVRVVDNSNCRVVWQG